MLLSDSKIWINNKEIFPTYFKVNPKSDDSYSGVMRFEFLEDWDTINPDGLKIEDLPEADIKILITSDLENLVRTFYGVKFKAILFGGLIVDGEITNEIELLFTYKQMSNESISTTTS